MLKTSRPTALITGASQRIGRALAETFHAQGYSIIIHFNQGNALARQLEETLNDRRPGSAATLCCDLSNSAEIKKLISKVYEHTDGLDILINNASVFEPDKENELTTQWDYVINTNAKACFELSKGLANLLESSQGNIINFIDIYAERPLKDHVVYSTSKAACDMLTKSLAIEMSPNVRVNGIAPGAILWPEKAMDEESKSALLSKIPMQRLGTTEAITETAVYLNRCDYITGQVIKVDGGRSITI